MPSSTRASDSRPKPKRFTHSMLDCGCGAGSHLFEQLVEPVNLGATFGGKRQMMQARE